MEQPKKQNGLIRTKVPSHRGVRYYTGPRGLIFILLAFSVLSVGFIGYVEYDKYVKPNLDFFICCLPAVILAIILFFLGYATRFSTVRRVTLSKPVTQSSKDLKRKRDHQKEVDSKDDFKSGGLNEKQKDSGGEFKSDNSRNIKTNGMIKYEPKNNNIEELISQKKNLKLFLRNLDEQHNDGLIMDNVYFNLKNKYTHELTILNKRLVSLKANKNRKK